MPIVLAFLGSAITAIAGYMVARFGERVAMAVAFGVVWFIVVALFTAAINAIVGGIAAAVPVGLVRTGMSMIPGNAAQCVSAILAGHGAAYIYTVQYKVLIQRLNV